MSNFKYLEKYEIYVTLKNQNESKDLPAFLHFYFKDERYRIEISLREGSLVIQTPLSSIKNITLGENNGLVFHALLRTTKEKKEVSENVKFFVFFARLPDRHNFLQLFEARVSSIIKIEIEESKYISSNSDPHWTFPIITKMKGFENYTLTANHRYSEFEALNSFFSRTLPKVVLPPFPPKLAPSRIEDRRKGLEDYLKNLIKKEEIIQNSECFKELIRFLRSEESTTELNFLKKWGLTYRPKMNNPIQDYKEGVSLLKKKNAYPSSVLWEKFTISLFGTTSAGKSSFINHLFTVCCTITSFSQVDTGYTIFQTCPPDQFENFIKKNNNHSHNNNWPNFSENELKNELSKSKFESDPRYNNVFTILDFEKASQFYLNIEEIKKWNVRSVMINEHYLLGTNEEKEFAKKIIVIDSKGIEQTSNSNLISQKSQQDEQNQLTEIQIRSNFIRISDLTLFLLPYNEINNAFYQMTSFELSVICSFFGSEFLKQSIQEMKQNENQNSSLLNYIPTIMQWTPLAPVGNVIDLFLTKNENTQNNNNVPNPLDSRLNFGNHRWEKILFIISKIDLAEEKGKTPNQIEKELFYSFGRLVGKGFKFIDPPTFSHVYSLGLPEKRREGIDFDNISNSLGELKSEIFEKSKKFDQKQKIQQCLFQVVKQLEEEMEKNPPSLWENLFSEDLNYIKRIKNTYF